MTQRSEPPKVLWPHETPDACPPQCSLCSCDRGWIAKHYDALAAENVKLREQIRDFTYILDRATAKVLADTKARLDEAERLFTTRGHIPYELWHRQVTAFLQRTDAGREEKEK